jgi:hypothetical protein
MYNLVSGTGHLFPGDIRIFFLEFLRNVFCSFTNDLKIANNCILGLAVFLEFFVFYPACLRVNSIYSLFNVTEKLNITSVRHR